MSIVIKSLHIHPVKSLRAIDLQQTRCLATGLEWDRAWLLVDHKGQFMSQRSTPGMAQIATSLTSDSLVLSKPEMGSVAAPLELQDGRNSEVEVWGDRCEVVDQGDAVANWIGIALGLAEAPRLVRMKDNFKRPQRHPNRYGSETHTGFADSAPYLFAGEASLETLNYALAGIGEQAVPMNRFRPNVVLSGLEAFREHALQRLEGPGYQFTLCYPRERCVITTMDQETGIKNPAGEPFKTLQRINPMPENPTGPAFAELGVLQSGRTMPITVGDELIPHWK